MFDGEYRVGEGPRLVTANNGDVRVLYKLRVDNSHDSSNHTAPVAALRY